MLQVSGALINLLPHIASHCYKGKAIPTFLNSLNYLKYFFIFLIMLHHYHKLNAKYCLCQNLEKVEG